MPSSTPDKSLVTDDTAAAAGSDQNTDGMSRDTTVRTDVTTTESPSPPPATNADPPTETNNKPPKKKKVDTPPPPPPPASVIMTYFLLRGAVSAVLGISMDDMVVSPFQPTYLAEGKPSGRFGIAFGKKHGNAQLRLGLDVDVIPISEKQRIYQAIHKAVNHQLHQIQEHQLQSTSHNTSSSCWSLFPMSKSMAVDQYGPGLLDLTLASSQKRKNNNNNNNQDDMNLSLIYMPDWVLAAIPSSMLPLPQSSKTDHNNDDMNDNDTGKYFYYLSHALGQIESIQLDEAYCNVSAGRKAKSTEITLKFRVVERDPVTHRTDDDAAVSVVDDNNSNNHDTITTNTAMTTTLPLLQPLPVEAVDPQVVAASLRQAIVRCTEGHLLLEEQQQQSSQKSPTDTGKMLSLSTPTTTTPTATPCIQTDDLAAAKTSSSDVTTGTTTQGVDETNDASAADEAMVVTIENVSGKIDYDKLVQQFGSKLLDDSLLQRLEQLTIQKRQRQQQQHSDSDDEGVIVPVPRLHRFLRRNIFFSHRDFDVLLRRLEESIDGGGASSGCPLYLYTGRGPSSQSMHLGHLIPFLFTKWLQEALDCPLVIQMTDDEKFLFKGTYEDATGDNLTHFQQLTLENAKDILACGFDYHKTFIFSDLDYVGRMYPNIVRIWKAVTTNAVQGIFGFDTTCNIGKLAFPAIQAAPSFATSFPVVLKGDPSMMCLIPCAIDQDPYFRMTRDVAHKLVPKQVPATTRESQSSLTSHTTMPSSSNSSTPSTSTAFAHPLGGKPALIHSKFFPPLQGATGKMSSSDFNSAIFLTDSAEEIERKIKEHAFSGGQETKKLQQELGANLDVDVSYQWLRFFLEDDDELEQIGKEYGSGRGEYWSTGKVKQRLIQVLQELVARHQERRAKITNEEVLKWMSERCIV